MDDRVDKAVDLFQNGLNCSQAILAAFGEPFGANVEIARRLGRPFGAGIGRLAKICGAITGAVMVLGLARDRQDEKAAKNAVYEDVRGLVHRFEEKYGSVECIDLLGEDIGSEEGSRKIQEAGLTKTFCPKLVRDAAEILSEVLAGS